MTGPGGGERLGGYWLVAASHALIDVFPMIITSLMIVLQHRLRLTPGQETAVWVIGPIFSGAFQPLFAWLGDRHDTRLAAPVGLAIAAACIGSIGFAQNFAQLVALQIVGVIGAGIYHPAAAAVAGQIGSRARLGRGFALSIFVAAGMVGHVVGPTLATRMNEWFGMESLAWLIPPTLAAALALHLALRRAPHRPHDHREHHASLSPRALRLRWVAALLLTIQSAFRNTVNTGLFILINYWAAAKVPNDPDAAAVLNGQLLTAATIGMAGGALFAGRLFPPGSERLSYAVASLLGALCTGAVNVVSEWGMILACVVTSLAGVGLFAPIPSTLGLGQRLLPGHAALMTAMVLGVAWMFGAAARPICAWHLGGASLEAAAQIGSAGFNRAFLGMALLLAAAGALALFMPPSAVRAASQRA